MKEDKVREKIKVFFTRKKIILLLLFIAMSLGCIKIISAYIVDMETIELSYLVKSENFNEFQIFYKENNNEIWSKEKMRAETYSAINEWTKLSFQLPNNIKSIRIDFGEKKQEIYVKDIYLTYNKKNIEIDLQQNSMMNQVSIENLQKQNKIKCIDIDPFIEFNYMENKINKLTKKSVSLGFIGYLLSIIIAFLMAIAIYHITNTLKFFSELYNNRKMVLKLAKNDFKTKYVSSYLGTIWAFVSPLITIATYWFVFQIGFRSTDIGNVPFIVWFVCGIVPWFFFSEAFSSGTTSLIEYSYLIKKMVFKVELLPVVKIVSALFVHLFFIGVIFIVYLVYGFSLSIYNVQILYYLLCMCVFLIAISMFSSAIVLFFRDLNQIIGIILNIGFWFTPVAWSYTMISGKWLILFKLNPLFYIVEGYRDCLVHEIWFFEKPYFTCYFWVLTLVVLFIGVKLFKKLKYDFADVL